MKNTRVLLITALAIIFGLAAGYSALRYLNTRPEVVQVAADNETVSAVLAARDLPLGKSLEDEDLRLIEWPAQALPLGVARTKEEVIGQSLITDVRANEVILASKLDQEGLLGILPLIEPGMRAMSISVDQVVGVAGFVTPQTKVDVILVMQPQGSTDMTSKIILQNVQALAAGETIQKTEDGSPVVVPVVTVLVTPDEAEKLALASQEGMIRLALRNTLDLETVETAGERRSRLFTGVAGSYSRANLRTGSTVPTAQESIMQIYRGGVRTLIRY